MPCIAGKPHVGWKLVVEGVDQVVDAGVDKRIQPSDLSKQVDPRTVSVIVKANNALHSRTSQGPVGGEVRLYKGNGPPPEGVIPVEQRVIEVEEQRAEIVKHQVVPCTNRSFASLRS